jgi:hypothetical protein
MRLSINVLRGLVAAVACISVTGCDLTAKAPPTEQPSYESTEPGSDPAAAPNEEPGKVCLPGACPACGRG